MGEYKILSAKTVHKSEKIQVDKRKIELPNGNVVEWHVVVFPNIYMGIPVRDGYAYLVKEWRQGPQKILTQFVGARAGFADEKKNMSELQRELKEELGLTGGKFEKILSVAIGSHISGFVSYFVVTDFQMGETKRDEHEIQEIIQLPIKGLFDELVANHVVQAETLLVAKLLEEKFGK